MLINKKIIYNSLIFLGLLSAFFVFNSQAVLASDFKVDVDTTEWKINSDGIYKNDSKIACSDIQVGSIPTEDGFLVKNSSGTKLFLITENNIYVSAKDFFVSLTYPGSISDSFVLKKTNNDVLLYVDGSGLHYKEGMCEEARCINDPGPTACESRSIANCDDGCQVETSCDSSNTTSNYGDSYYCNMCCNTPSGYGAAQYSSACYPLYCEYYKPNQPNQGWRCGCYGTRDCCGVVGGQCVLNPEGFACCSGSCEIDTQECTGDPNPCSFYGDESSCNAADGCSWWVPYEPLVCGNGNLEPGEDCESDSDCDTPLQICENCECVINYDCETNADCEDRFGNDYLCDDCECKIWLPYGNKPNLVPYDICIDAGGECELSVDCGFDPGSYCDQEAGCSCAVWPPEPKPAGTCGDDPPGCFSKGMKVYTPNGNISIEDIKAGNIVYSYNEDTGKLEESKVGKIFVHEDFRDPAVRLILSNGILLNSTLNHPFYSLKHEKYLPLEKFDIGNEVLFYNNKIGQFEEVKILEFEDVDYFYYEYSLHLEGPFNNYFVNGVIVHNASDIGDKGGDDPLD